MLNTAMTISNIFLQLNLYVSHYAIKNNKNKEETLFINHVYSFTFYIIKTFSLQTKKLNI